MGLPLRHRSNALHPTVRPSGWWQVLGSLGGRPILCGLLLAAGHCLFSRASADDRLDRGLRPMLTGHLARPLRYSPDRGDFVIANGSERFNRPLYGGSSAFRVDAGDRPEYSIYLPGRGGNLRLAFRTSGGPVWLQDAAEVVGRYRAGSMRHEVRDPRLGPGWLEVVALTPRTPEGLLIRLEAHNLVLPLEIFAAYGGITGQRHGRDGDIGTDRLPMREYFQLQPDHCRGNRITISQGGFTVQQDGHRVDVVLSARGTAHIADAALWQDVRALIESGAPTGPPLGVASFPLSNGSPAYLGLHYTGPREGPAELPATYREVAAERRPIREAGATPSDPVWAPADLPTSFASAESARAALAGQVTVDTPDAFINAALPALNVAADAVWDDRQQAFLHGAVAWRVRLLGWRVAYAGDALGRHERTRAHFDGYAAQQNTGAIPERVPDPEPTANRARNESALHSNGDLTQSHYDMNLVGVDTFFRHLCWTGDLEYARRMWPVIERHLAWERRLFRREFGPERLPLYEAYACIWASDALSYNGGGATHATAYNLFHHRMAARVAELLGLDGSAYRREAALIERAMSDHLWLADRGWFGEGKDFFGLQQVHPSAAAWTFYHAVDSNVPSALAAWQMSRYVDTELPHFPLEGPGVPTGTSTLATSTWMPWKWSLNNVVLAETAHTALGFWQANRAEPAYALLKGALLDSMFLGICPGNVGMCTWFDAYRRESQRDFGDGIGILSRAIVEGLFGIAPDLLAGEVRIRPGFPSDWAHARMRHPDFTFAFRREGDSEQYTIEPRFARPVALRLQLAARGAEPRVELDGRPVAWRMLESSVGPPRLEVTLPPETRSGRVVVHWRGHPPASPPAEVAAARQTEISIECGAPVVQLFDPQGTLEDAVIEGSRVRGRVVGVPGHRTLFARLRYGALSWWQPLALEVRAFAPVKPIVFTTDWLASKVALARCEPVPLEEVFNDSVTQIFRHDYVVPRSPFGSLSVPQHGYGDWCGPTNTFAVNDDGLRRTAAASGGRLLLPNGVPLTTPSAAPMRNVAFVSQWRNFPDTVSVPLRGRGAKLYLLLVGSTNGNQSRFDNGEVVVGYADGSTTRVALENPTTWWPIDQDYFIDDFAFRRPGRLPLRVDLRTGRMRVLDPGTFRGRGGRIDGGAATVLDLSLEPGKELASLTVRALANEVVIGLMSATVERP